MEVSGSLFTLLLSATVAVFVWILVRRWKKPDPLVHIPSPPGIPVLGNMLQISPTKPRLTFQEWARKYGEIYRLSSIVGGELVVVSAYDCIHEILVTKGAAFSNRVKNFRLNYVMNGDMFSFMDHNATCHTLRKLSHRFMKQFGDGLSELEVNLQDAEKQMIADLEATQCSPVNTLDIMKNTALRSISVLLMGRPVDPDEQLWELLVRYEGTFGRCLNPVRLDMIMLDKFPWLIHFPLQCSREIKKLKKLQDELWRVIKENHKQTEYDSLTKVLLEHIASQCNDGSFVNPDDRYKLTGITDRQAGLSCLLLILAGITTTSKAMHILTNILAYRRDVQNKIREEVVRVLGATNKDHCLLEGKINDALLAGHYSGVHATLSYYNFGWNSTPSSQRHRAH